MREIINENFIINKNNVYHNIDKFKSGKSNVLFVCGLSGSGKTTLSKKIAIEYNDCIIIELDKLIDGDILRHSNLENYQKKCSSGELIIYNWLHKNKKYRYDLINKNNVEHMVSKFINHVLTIASENQEYKYIIEGMIIQLDDYSFVYDYPIIIKRTSTVNSFINMMRRSNYKFKDMEDFINILSFYIDDDKKLNDFLLNLESR